MNKHKLNNFLSLLSVCLGIFCILAGISYFAVPLGLIIAGIVLLVYGLKSRGGVYRSFTYFMSNFYKSPRR